MAYRDGIHNNKAVLAIVPAIYAGSQNGPAISMVGYGSAQFLFLSGAIAGAGAMGCKLQEAPDASGSPGAWTDVSVDNIQDGSEVVSPVTASLAMRIGYAGSQPWVRAVITLASGTSVAMAAVATLGHPTQVPVV